MNGGLRRALRTVGVVAASAGLLVVGAGVASAHVTVDPSTTAAGGYSILTFSVPHGCDGSATTRVNIQIPEGINSVTPTINPGWTVEKSMAQLDSPIKDAHGNELTQRVGEVVYTAKTPLPDGYRDAFELSVQLPDEPGQTLVFPTIQKCEDGETAWIETAAAGADEPEHPAPSFTMTAADGAGHGHASDGDDAAGQDGAGVDAASGSSVGVVGWIALVLGGLGLIAGSAALLRGRKAS